MKTFAIVIGTITLAVVLVMVGFLAGSIWSQSRWGNNVMANEMMGPMGMGPGMMGDNWNRNDMPCGVGYVVPGAGDVSSLEDVETVAHEYVERLGYSGLEVTEVMEFEHMKELLSR